MNDLLTENRSILKDVIRAQGQALASVHDLSFKMMKGSFNRGHFTVVTRYGIPAIEAELHQEFVTAWLPRVGLPLDIIGREYTSEGVVYRVVDLSEKLDMKCVRVIKVDETDGKRFKVSPRKIREAFNIPEPAEEEPEDDGDEIDQ